MSKNRHTYIYVLQKRIGKLCLSLCFLLTYHAYANLPDNKTLEAQRKQFIQAETALKKKQTAEYNKLAGLLKDYPLYPYLVYQDLKQKAETHPTQVTEADLDNFRKDYPDFPYHDSLRKNWLAHLYQKKQWQTFIKGYRAELKDIALECQYDDIQYKQSQKSEWLDNGLKIWMSGKKRPSECEPLFKTLKQHGKLTPENIWKRIILAAEAKNSELIPLIAKPLPHADKKIVGFWEKGLSDPMLIFEPKWQEHIASTPPAQKSALITQVVLRLAKKDPEAALKWFDDNKNIATLTQKEKNTIQHDIAMYLAHQRSPLALSYIKQLPKTILDQSLQEWRVRLAIYYQDYDLALHEIYQLPEILQKEMPWEYWRARALEKLGKKADAKAMYEYLSHHRSYYGLLASHRLNKPFNLYNNPLKISPYDVSFIQAKAPIKRSIELLHLNRQANARAEWSKGLEGTSNEQKAAAAKLAENWGAPGLAIYAISKTPYKDDVALRFPLAYLPKVQSLASYYNLDPAWIFAVIRQESAFQADAISPVGAKGLMQIMPETGKSLAKNHDIPYTAETNLYDPITNITLGAAYIKDLKALMKNNRILATASYNAGPNRTKKWLPENTMEPDIWIETIPFRETREYVKNIMAYQAIYHQRLDTPSILSEWLIPIPGSNAKPPEKVSDITANKKG